MTADGWRAVVSAAAQEGNEEALGLLATHLANCDRAKQIFCDLGWSWTGLSLLGTAEHIRDWGVISPQVVGHATE